MVIFSKLKVGKIVSIVFVLVLVISGLVFTASTNSADIVPTPINTGIGIPGSANCSTYLKEVDVTLDLYKNHSEGNGKFILENPSDQRENLTLFFDPSHEPKNCEVFVDGEEVEIWKKMLNLSYYEKNDLINPYNVVFFEVSIKPEQAKNVSIGWDMASSNLRTYIDQYYISYSRDWQVSYMIISREGWEEPIERVNVKIDVHSQCFQEADISTGDADSFVRKENSDGFSTIYVNYTDWYESNQKITIDGRETVRYSSFPKMKVENPTYVSVGEGIDIYTSFISTSRYTGNDLSVDDEFFQKVVCNYKTMNGTEFKSLEMEPKGDHFHLNIPGIGGSSKLEFYIKAYYSIEGKQFTNKSKTYTVDIERKGLSTLPEIDVDRPLNCSTGDDIEIKAYFLSKDDGSSNTIDPNDKAVEEVKLFYKKREDSDYSSKSMIPQNDHFYVEITAPKNCLKLDFYITSTFIVEGESVDHESQKYVVDISEAGSSSETNPEDEYLPSTGILALIITLISVSFLEYRKKEYKGKYRK